MDGQCRYCSDDKTPFSGQDHIDWLRTNFCGFFWNLERMYLWLVWCFLYWKPCFSRAVPQTYWLATYKLMCFFFWNLERMYLWLVWCSLYWKPCFSRAVPQTIWEDVSQATVFSLAQIKLFSIPITDCLSLPLILYILNILQLCQLFLNKAGGGGVGGGGGAQSLQLNYHNQPSKQSHAVSPMFWPTVPFSGIYIILFLKFSLSIYFMMWGL